MNVKVKSPSRKKGEVAIVIDGPTPQELTAEVEKGGAGKKGTTC